jgi:serine/threonine-protein kinase RsbW
MGRTGDVSRLHRHFLKGFDTWNSVTIFKLPAFSFPDCQSIECLTLFFIDCVASSGLGTTLALITHRSGDEVTVQRKLEPMDLEIWAPSEISRISPLVNRLVHFVELAGCVPGEEANVQLALLEAVANAIIHGNRMDPQKRVHVTCRCEPGNGVSIAVGDEGHGFDPSEIPEVVDPECEHGRGILFMKFYMDEVSFEKGGTQVRMWKASPRKWGTAPENTNQTIHAESASRHDRDVVIAGTSQERGETC